MTDALEFKGSLSQFLAGGGRLYKYGCLPPLPINFMFSDIDRDLLRVLLGSEPEPIRQREECGPVRCNHGFHRPCEECEPALFIRWVATVSGVGEE